MQASQLWRLSGLAAFFSVFFLIILGIGSLISDPGLSTYQAIQFSGALAHLLFLFVIIGVYTRDHDRLGVLGLVGFILGIVGNSEFVTGQYVGAFVTIPEMTDIPLALALPIGLLLLAIANQRNGRLPNWGMWLMFLGHLLNNLLGAPLGSLDLPILSQIIVFAAGIAIVGLALWNSPDEVSADAYKSGGARQAQSSNPDR